MLEDAVAIAGLLGFGLSVFLGYLKFVEWRAKPDLRLDMDWIVGGGGPTTLRIVAENRGQATGGVRNIVLAPGEDVDPSTNYALLQHMDDLPIRLDPGQFARFPIELDPNRHSTFTDGLLGGGLTHAILIDQGGSARAFPIPAQPPEQDNRVSLTGRVVTR